MALNDLINNLNGVLFSDYTVYALLLTGLVFTVWSFFGQYRALTHGVSVIRGKYDDHNDPGAINHFQALSAALSATVGLGNIAGVAIAVALGGPGAIFWMWVIGILGMALKMTEVTQSMIFRDTREPDNPHGGPMFVVSEGLRGAGTMRFVAAALFALLTLALTYFAQGIFESTMVWIPGGLLALIFLVLGLVSGRALGLWIGAVFVVTLIISAITGGNMFQAWNVADITFTYFGVPQIVTGVVLTLLVGMVIIGGIKRIGAVAGRVVPFMCALYVISALVVLVSNIDSVPEMFMLIVKSGLGIESPAPYGAFLGGTFVYAAMWGVKRALFSSEAGQGSSPIAHSAAKTDEPVREGVVAGLEPFIDTIVVCTLTALVILSTGAYNRSSEADFASADAVNILLASETAGQLAQEPVMTVQDGSWVAPSMPAPDRTPTTEEAKKATETGKPVPGWKKSEKVFVFADAQPGDRVLTLSGKLRKQDNGYAIDFDPIASQKDDGTPAIESISPRTQLYFGTKPAWTLETNPLPRMSPESRKYRQTDKNNSGWRDGEIVFFIVEADIDHNTGRDLRKITGSVHYIEDESDDNASGRWIVDWNTLESQVKPFFRKHDDGSTDLGIYGDYAGAAMTAYAFDRQFPGLGKWLVSAATWLFAVSTMISWSYYGEQGIYYMTSSMGSFGKSIENASVFSYKIIYSLLILLTTVLAMPLFGSDKHAIIATDHELDMWTTLGLGVMLVANIPIMWLFGAKAMRTYHDYFKRMEHGGDDAHKAPPFTDVVEGKDVE